MTQSHEALGNPQGLLIFETNIDELYAAAAQGKSGEVGHMYVPSPAESLKVDMWSDGKQFDLGATLVVDGLRAESIVNNLRPYFEYANEWLGRRGGRDLVRGPHGTTVVLGSYLGDLLISTGKVQGGSYLEQRLYGSRSVVDSPSLSEENLRSALADMQYALDLVFRDLCGEGLPAEETSDDDDEGEKNNELRRQLSFGPEIIHIGAPRAEQSEQSRGLDIQSLVVEASNIGLNQIGGQPEAVQAIADAADAFAHPEIYEQYGAKPPKGVLFFGPPGTGKTLSAQALATRAGVRFLYVKASDITSKWYGQAEQNMRQLFEAAKQVPTIVYIDELDALAPDRANGIHEASSRVISELLQAMNGMVRDDRVLVVASTNRPDAIDPAILRSGRFDVQIEMKLPNQKGREHALAIHLDMAVARASGNRDLFALDASHIEAIAQKTDGLSQADLAELIRRTVAGKAAQAVRALRGEASQPGPVTVEDVMEQVARLEHANGTASGKLPMGFH